MKFLNFIKSLLFTAPKIEEAVEKIEAIAVEVTTAAKPKKKRVYKKKK